MFDLYDGYFEEESRSFLGQPALPSGDSALRLVQGDTSAASTVLLHWGLRTVLIASGLYLAGMREKVWLGAFGGSTAIELFVLGWAATHRDA